MKNILVDSLIHRLLFSPNRWWIRHALFWIFVYLDEFLSIIGLTERYDDYWTILFSLGFDIALVYFNLLILYPKFLKTGRLGEYAFYTALSVAVLFFCEYMVDIFYWSDWGISLDYFVTVFTTTAITLTSAVAIKILKDNIQESQRREEAENQKLSIELEMLKKQVNPHFLFNVLNGIYIQSQTEQEKVAESIMQLSDLLRYQIYDAERNEKISLSKEITFIENYIALEKMRREDMDINFEKRIENPNFLIDPLLIVPIVENAFKYSVAKMGEHSVIDFMIHQVGQVLSVSIQNSIGIAPSQKEDEGGIGLTNLRKRLEHLYPNSHTLNLDTSKDGIFSVKLEIQVNEMHYRR